jgi:O-acetylserine/cysteine efflux transporter
MCGRDLVLAALTSVAWGLAFVAGKLALESFSAPQLTALRFLIACVPVLALPRPALSWGAIALIGLTLFTGQFLLLFSALARGMPPGLASVTQQMQAFFTVLLAAVFLREVPSPRQNLGMGVAFTGLALVGASAGGADLPWTALGLALAGAFSWAVGNVLVKRTPGIPILGLVAWAGLVPPGPALVVSHLADDPPLGPALLAASWRSLAAVLYLGAVATIWAYATWGRLLRRYTAAAVTPFALLAPCAGVVSSALVFGEAPSPLRWGGMVLILAGLAVTVLPADRRPRRRPAARGA